MQIMGNLILDKLEYVLEVEYQYKSVEKYTNPMLFPLAYISVYTVTACKFWVHFLEIIKYRFHPYTKLNHKH